MGMLRQTQVVSPSPETLGPSIVLSELDLGMEILDLGLFT